MCSHSYIIFKFLDEKKKMPDEYFCGVIKPTAIFVQIQMFSKISQDRAKQTDNRLEESPD